MTSIILLTVINGYSQILSEELAGHPSGRSLELIKQAGHRAAALTKKILTFSRHHVFEQKPVQLNVIIRDIADLLKSLIGEHIKLAVSVDPSAGKVLADPVQLEQVVLNLLVNARDAMPEGGVISLETTNADTRRHLRKTASWIGRRPICGLDRSRYRLWNGRRNAGAHV